MVFMLIIMAISAVLFGLTLLVEYVQYIVKLYNPKPKAHVICAFKSFSELFCSEWFLKACIR